MFRMAKGGVIGHKIGVSGRDEIKNLLRLGKWLDFVFGFGFFKIEIALQQSCRWLRPKSLN